MTTVLVTGGAGYVGAHACKALAAAGYAPVVYDNLVTGRRAAVRWGPFEHGDVLDRVRLDAVFRRHRPSAVVHCAALAQVGDSIADPGSYYRDNIAGSLVLSEAMRDHGVDRIVFSSSCTVYGVPDVVPVRESAPIAPISPYGTSKAVVERMLADFGVAHGLRWIALRYFNAAGADLDGEIGEERHPQTRIVPLAIEAAATGRPLTVHGTDYDTPDGTCVRDFVHVADLADAHVAALRACERGLPSGPFNLGTGTGVSVREVIAAVEAVGRRVVPVAEGPRRPGDPPALWADAGEAARRLDWRPSRSDLRTIVESAWRWHAGRSGRSRDDDRRSVR